MEALRAAVATVAQYDEWDLALPHITFGLDTHVSTATKVSPFEFAHGFSARVSLIFGQQSAQAPLGEVLDMGTAAISNRMKMSHWAAADHMTAAQARLGHLLAKHSRLATLNVGDLVWLDSRHTPNDIPFKLTASIHSSSSQGCPGYTGFTIYVWQGTSSSQHFASQIFRVSG